MILFFLPVLFVVILGPAILRVQDMQKGKSPTPDSRTVVDKKQPPLAGAPSPGSPPRCRSRPADQLVEAGQLERHLGGLDPWFCRYQPCTPSSGAISEPLSPAPVACR